MIPWHLNIHCTESQVAVQLHTCQASVRAARTFDVEKRASDAVTLLSKEAPEDQVPCLHT